MHSIAEVVIPSAFNTDDLIKKAVDDAFSYFLPEDEEGNKTKDYADWWDWYVIGGRFSGHKMESRIDPEVLEAFQQKLVDEKITVSSVTCGKQSIKPKSQISKVDTLWREMVPGNGDQCWLFDHAINPYGRDGIFGGDVCTISQIPDKLLCQRLMVCSSHYSKPGELYPMRMWTKDIWNHVEHQDTGWDGNVKTGLDKMKADYRGLPKDFSDDWLVVTVDYHN